MKQEGRKRLEMDPMVRDLVEWLSDQALDDPALPALFEDCTERLMAMGLPLLRTHLSFRTLHPLHESMSMTWRRGQALEVAYFTRQDLDSDAWRMSPLYHLIQTGLPFVRRRLVGAEATLDFPLLEDLRAEGVSEYLGFLVPFGPSRRKGVVGSWAGDRPSGFSEGDIAVLTEITRHLAVACRVQIERQIAANVARAFLGAEAGEAVLEGLIQRGDGEARKAAIWYADLRGSTAMAERLGVGRFLKRLDRYFECTGGEILKHGGEVLALVGDAVLGIFPIAEGRFGEAGARAAALEAALSAQKALAGANAEAPEAPPLACGIGLHVGEILVGNIGVPERLQFTAIGSAVNVTARLEELTKTHARPILASRPFAEGSGPAFETLGRQALRGCPGEWEILAPRPR